MKRIVLIDFLRGYSIFTIVVYHFIAFVSKSEILNQLITFGGTGIHLFVLMSGYGLYFSYLRKPLNFYEFIKRRLIKLYIPYIMVVLLSAFISVFIPIYENSLYALGGHIFFYKMFDESIMGSYGYPLWFISMIFQFYFVFHLLTFLIKKINKNTFLILSIVVSLAWSVVVILLGKENYRIWNSFFLQYLWEFVLGMVIAGKVFNNESQFNFFKRKYRLFLIGIINCAIYAFMALSAGQIGRMLNDIFALLGYSALAIWLYFLGIKFINRFFLFVGNNSLSVYLLHMLILLLVANLLSFIPLAAVGAISLALVIVLSVFYQKIVDKLLRYFGI